VKDRLPVRGVGPMNLEAADVGAACQARGVECDFVDSRILPPVDERPYFAAEQVVYPELELAGF